MTVSGVGVSTWQNMNDGGGVGVSTWLNGNDGGGCRGINVAESCAISPPFVIPAQAGIQVLVYVLRLIPYSTLTLVHWCVITTALTNTTYGFPPTRE